MQKAKGDVYGRFSSGELQHPVHQSHPSTRTNPPASRKKKRVENIPLVELSSSGFIPKLDTVLPYRLAMHSSQSMSTQPISHSSQQS